MRNYDVSSERKTAGYVARTARDELIFGGSCRERRGEADSGLIFLLKNLRLLLKKLKIRKSILEKIVFLGSLVKKQFEIL